MKNQSESKLGGYIEFSMVAAHNSFITYNQIRLYYPKFQHQKFSTLTQQYKKITGGDLPLNINGLAIGQDLEIEQIIQTQEEERTFELALTQNNQASLKLPRALWVPFNRLLFRIMCSGKYQEKLPLEIKSANDIAQQNPATIPYLIYWIDDIPQNNAKLIDFHLTPAKIRVVQVQSTEQMVGRLEHEYNVYKEQGTNILFISDMSRKEGKNMNYTAGIDLFEEIYHKRELKEPSIAYVGNKKYTLQAMAERKLNMSAISVVNSQSELINLVYQHFSIMKK